MGPWALHLRYPFRWAYSVLRGADHLRRSASAAGLDPDQRMADAIEAIRIQRQDDGTWLQGTRMPGRAWFEVDAPEGEPSRWLTFFCVRILNWWDDATGPDAGQRPVA